MAIRLRTLADGRRQMLGIVLPGDLFACDSVLLEDSTATVVTLTPALVVEFRASMLARVFEDEPRLVASLLWMSAREEAFLGERLMGVGRQSAFERIGHFLVELYHHLRLVGPRARQ